MAGLLGFTLADLSGAVDSRKRQYANLVRGLLSDPGATLAQLAAVDAEAARGNRYTQMSAGSVMPEVAQQGQEAMLNAALNVGGLLGITAYHGSPHTFDKFDMSKIGTGEGAQAYGHGLYFAESKDVARSYQNALSDLFPEGTRPPPGSAADRAAAFAASEIDSQAHYPFVSAAQKAERFLENDPQKKAIINQLNEWHRNGTEFRRAGNLYKVDIPDEAVSKMLDWDKPLSQQPEAVRKALGNVAPMALTDGMPLAGGGKLRIANDPDFGPKYFLEMGDSKMRLNAADVQNLVGSGLEGKSLYQGLKAKLGSDDKVSAYLKQQGIPGIRYLDAGSRGNGGTSNFVLFDDNLPKILSRE